MKTFSLKEFKWQRLIFCCVKKVNLITNVKMYPKYSLITDISKISIWWTIWKYIETKEAFIVLIMGNSFIFCSPRTKPGQKFWSLYLKIIYSKAHASQWIFTYVSVCLLKYSQPKSNNQHSLHPKCTYAPLSQGNHYIYVYIKQWKHIRVLAICVLREILPCIFCFTFKTNKILFLKSFNTHLLGNH